jgi:hypothetical protein
MPNRSLTYRVLIASPSDLMEERQVLCSVFALGSTRFHAKGKK